MDAGLRQALQDAIGRARGTRFVARSVHAAGGGCIHRSYLLEGAGGRYFAKTNDARFADAFAAEADGLEALAKTGVRVPGPVACGAQGAHAYLVLEQLELRSGSAASFGNLGRALALVHSTQGVAYGWQRDNYIGSTPQRNDRMGDWTRFWRDQRLVPQLELAQANGHGALRPIGERLCERLDALLKGHRPAASLLHGDLWSGNAAFLADGTPVLFDPAVYYGDAEADLAMTELFGGFAPSFYAAYRELRPIDPGYAMRKDLYNLYHALNHANLFGGGYVAQAKAMMEKLAALA